MFSSPVRVFVCEQLPGHNSNGPNAPGRFIMWYRNLLPLPRPLPVTDILTTESEVSREATLTWNNDEIFTEDHHKSQHHLSLRSYSLFLQGSSYLGRVMSLLGRKKYTLVYTRNDTYVKGI
ncbi:uncharacterized protein [Palaemon carinicauda]|uniref:uncharacterized protein isoform X2 n=1 Tax=Palaemon carinicauda TaxID=392227 RepID=UPI0035B5DF8A